MVGSAYVKVSKIQEFIQDTKMVDGQGQFYELGDGKSPAFSIFRGITIETKVTTV